jgi:hypothetical protein
VEVADRKSMRKHITYLALAMLPTGFLWSQSIEDVQRFSQTTYLGSARYMGAGGAFTSLGNDFSAAHQNPAGFAVFRRTELSLSLGGLNSGTSTSFKGSTRIEDLGGFNFGNIGLVLALPEENGWKWNVGMSLNKGADYTNRLTTNGETNGISRINMWMENSQGFDPDDLLDAGRVHEWMAFQSYLTDSDGEFNYSTQANIEDVNSVYTIDQKGGMNEFALLFATEKDNRWYFGGALGIPFINYTRDIVYSERFGLGDSITSFDLKEHNEISGVGFNIKLGAQYRFDNGFRAGAALHTPSWYTMEQSWEDEMFTRFNDGSVLEPITSVYSDPYTWKLSTPWRGLLGISKVFGKSGFISVDYELNAMNTARSKSDSINIDYLDQEIKAFTQLSHIVRAGAELRLNRFYLRGGYSFQTSGLNGNFEETNTNMISIGAGYRGNDLSIDFVYALRNTGQDVYFYDAQYSPSAQSDITQKPLTFTMSYRIGNR